MRPSLEKSCNIKACVGEPGNLIVGSNHNHCFLVSASFCNPMTVLHVGGKLFKLETVCLSSVLTELEDSTKYSTGYQLPSPNGALTMQALRVRGDLTVDISTSGVFLAAMQTDYKSSNHRNLHQKYAPWEVGFRMSFSRCMLCSVSLKDKHTTRYRPPTARQEHNIPTASFPMTNSLNQNWGCCHYGCLHQQIYQNVWKNLRAGTSWNGSNGR